ncbi:branched-chain amino acid ABC transporter permease [soil metagenome]
MTSAMRSQTIGLAVAAVVLAFVPLLVGETYTLDILIRILLFVGLCSAWNIVGGMAGQLAFSHSLYIAAGAYSVGVFANMGLSPWLGLALAVIISVALGMLIAWLSARFALPHLSFALITLAFSELGLLVVISFKSLGGPAGMSIPYTGNDNFFNYETTSDFVHYWIALVLAVLSLGIGLVLWYTRLGIQFRSVKDNERAASALGVSPLRVKVTSMSISAALTALLGGAYAMYMGFIDPHFFASPTLIIQIILFSAVGGMGTVWGPALGAVLLVPMSDFLRTQFGGTLPPGAHVVFYGIFVIVVILLARGGLLDVVQRLVRRARKRSVARGSDATGADSLVAADAEMTEKVGRNK